MMSNHGRPSPASETGVIVARPTFARVGGLIIVGVVIIVFGLVLTGVAVEGPGFLRFVGLGLLLLGALAVVVPLLLRIDGVASRITGWAHPTLEITPWPLPLGSPATVTYHRRPVRASTLNTFAGAPSVLAELVCEEWVRYTVGTTTHTESDEIVRLRASTPGQVAGDEVQAMFQLTIPVDVGGPTLSLRNNRVSWRLETRLGEPFGRRTSTRTELTVPTVIDREAVVGEGGSEYR